MTAPALRRKKAKNPLLGVVGLLTTGVLIRVRLSLCLRNRPHSCEAEIVFLSVLLVPWHALLLNFPSISKRESDLLWIPLHKRRFCG